MTINFFNWRKLLQFFFKYFHKMTNANFKISKWLRELKKLESEVIYLKQNNEEFLALASKWNSNKLEIGVWNFTK